MARFANTQGSSTEAINTIADVANLVGQMAYNALTTSSPTLTAAQSVNGIVNLSGQTAAQTVTLPTAALICAAIPNCQVGSAFELILQNANTSSGAVTLAAGTGNTLVGTTAVPITKTQIYRGIVTNATTPTVSVYGILTAPV
jgi:hypothetical protein